MKKEEILLELKQLLFAKKLNIQEVDEINRILQSCYADELQPKKKKIFLINFLNSFWNYDNSEYIQNKVLHGQRIGRRYCYEQIRMIKYWKYFFSEDKTIDSITPEELVEFERFLKRITTQHGKPLRNETINNIIKCGKGALKWAVKKQYISHNPCDCLTSFSIHHRERGVLSNYELKKLFSKGLWSDIRVKAASMLSVCSGMRIGEILALRKCDIDEKYIYVNHSWGAMFGLTPPKNGFTRKIPLYPEIKEILTELINSNPHEEFYKTDNAYIFWGISNLRPASDDLIRKGFYKALTTIGISEEERRKRNIVFHSWRHYHATELTSRCNEHSAQVVLGHLTPLMTKHYSNHRTDRDLENVRKAMLPVVKSVFS